MAIVVTPAGVAANDKSSLAAIVTTNQSWAIGDTVIIVGSSDLILGLAKLTGAGASGADLSCTKRVSADNNTNVEISIWDAVVLTAVVNPTAAVSNGDFDAKCIAVYKVTGLGAFDKGASATGNGTAAASGATDTLSQADELVIGAIGAEDEIDDQTGSWVTGSGNVSGNEQETGTNGGGDSSNISIYSAAEVVAVTTAQNADNTGMDTVDWAAAVATYRGAVAATEQAYGFWF